MKKQFLFSALAVVLAVSGVFASTNMDDEFYPGGDNTCSLSPTNTRPCPVGVGAQCKDDNNNLQHFYKINGEGECLPLERSPE